MDKNQKKILLIGTLILLIIINISALTTMFYQNKIKDKRIGHEEKLRDEVRIRGMHHYIKEELKLSEDQFEKFQEVNKTNMIKSHQIATELNIKRHEMMLELAKLNPNEKILDNIAADIGNFHYQLKKLTITHFIELKEICNEEQQIKLQEIFFKIIGERSDERMNRGPRDKGRKRHNPGSSR